MCDGDPRPDAASGFLTIAELGGPQGRGRGETAEGDVCPLWWRRKRGRWTARRDDSRRDETTVGENGRPVATVSGRHGWRSSDKAGESSESMDGRMDGWMDGWTKPLLRP